MPITSWNPQLVTRRIYGAARPAATETLVVAKALSPKRTGKLAGGIRIGSSVGGFSILGGPVQVYELDARRTDYAVPVTGGTKFMKGNPFMNVAASGYRAAFFRRATF